MLEQNFKAMAGHTLDAEQHSRLKQVFGNGTASTGAGGETQAVRRLSSDRVQAAAEKAAKAKKKRKGRSVKKGSAADSAASSEAGTTSTKTKEKSSKDKVKKSKKRSKKSASKAPAGTGITAADLEDGLPVRVFRENGVTLLGTVRYVGPAEFFKGDWVGVELDDKEGGLNDGSVQGVRYFKCPPKAGIFVRPEATQPLVM